MTSELGLKIEVGSHSVSKKSKRQQGKEKWYDEQPFTVHVILKRTLLSVSLQVFQGNWDAYHVVKREFKNMIKSRFFRIYPQTWNHGLALKFELYTCTRFS